VYVTGAAPTSRETLEYFLSLVCIELVDYMCSSGVCGTMSDQDEDLSNCLEYLYPDNYKGNAVV
jgi:hypothetical protein